MDIDFQQVLLFFSHPMNKQAPAVFCEKVKQALLDNLNKGSFGYSLSYVTLLAQRDSSLISALFRLNFDSPEIMSAIEESYQFVLSNSNSDVQIAQFKMSLLQISADRYVRYPNPRLGRFILQIISGLGGDYDVPNFLFVDLAKRVESFVQLFSILGVYLLRANKEQSEKCSVYVQQNTDTFSLKSRSQAMMLICAGVKENTGLAFEMAASETECVSIITNSFEQFTNK